MTRTEPPDPIPALAAARERVRSTLAEYRAAMAAEAVALLAEVQRELPGVSLVADDNDGAARTCVWWRDVWTDGIMFTRGYVPGHGWRWDADFEGDVDGDAQRGTGETIADALTALAVEGKEAAVAVAALRAEVPDAS